MVHAREDVTPYSSITCIILFVPTVFLLNSYGLLILQPLVIVASILVGRVRVDALHAWQALHLAPIILFVFLINTFRGGGEILIRIGPLIVLKQGMMRGGYVSLFIVELFFMGRVMTAASSRSSLMSVLTRFERLIILPRKRRRLSAPGSTDTLGKPSSEGETRRLGVFTVLYHVLVIFKHTYGELRLFFPRRRGRRGSQAPDNGGIDPSGRRGIGSRLILFFSRVFERSLEVYQSSPHTEPVSMTLRDGVLILLQICVIASGFVLRGATV
jgi:hypothetical protein